MHYSTQRDLTRRDTAQHDTLLLENLVENVSLECVQSCFAHYIYLISPGDIQGPFRPLHVPVSGACEPRFAYYIHLSPEGVQRSLWWRSFIHLSGTCPKPLRLPCPLRPGHTGCTGTRLESALLRINKYIRNFAGLDIALDCTALLDTTRPDAT